VRYYALRPYAKHDSLTAPIAAFVPYITEFLGYTVDKPAFRRMQPAHPCFVSTTAPPLGHQSSVGYHTETECLISWIFPHSDKLDGVLVSFNRFAIDEQTGFLMWQSRDVAPWNMFTLILKHIPRSGFEDITKKINADLGK